ncbi:hypothetical protein [Myceligenerans crystallogenes]|uniref:Uncharacterized protein n=1 Tax=Myceligenerans crystallogenes TaxID=316335 RepID=A0ABP4ZXB1_9MICO
MSDTPPPAIDVAARWRALERAFAARRYDGDRPEALPGRSLTEPSPGIVEIAGTSRPGLVVTAVHATNHARHGTAKWADRGTGGLALLLAELTGCGALVAVGSLAAEPGDANFDAAHPLKDRLAELAPGVVLDLHGMRTRDGFDVDLGCGEGALPERLLAALDAAPLRVTRNALFDAMRPTTVAAFAQARGIRAVQAEIGAHLRLPESADARLVAALAAGIEAEAAVSSPGLSAPGAAAAKDAPRSVTHRLDTVLAPMFAGVPMVVLHPGLLPGAHGAVPVTVRAGGRSTIAWAWAADAAGVPSRLRELPPARAGLTRMTVAALTAGSGLGTAVDRAEVVIPPMRRLRMVSALGDDLPGPHEVQVSGQDFPRPGAYLLVRDGVTEWVTAVPREHVRPGTVRIDHAHRTLTSVRTEPGTAPAPDAPGYLALVSAPRALVDRPYAAPAPRRAATAADQQAERLWRRVFGAPEFSARVLQAHTGDDSTSVVTLSRGAFDRIGITPGMEVIVRWGGREAVARAVEEHEEPLNPDQAAKRQQRVNLVWPDVPAELSAQDVVRLSVRLRAQLGAPVSTVVTVRRRMRTYLTANLYKFAVPVAGFGLAIHQINDPRWPVIGGAAAVMTLFALARLRMPRPPRHPRVDKRWIDKMAS